jgi:uncharacterized protein (TIGR02757 family)
VDNKQTRLKTILEKLYARYNHRHLIKPDPLQFVYKYSNNADMEIAGFLAAALAYGRVQQIEKSLTDLLARMNGSPYSFILHFDNKKRRGLKSFKHRFTTGDDISDLLMLLKKVLIRCGSIEKSFIQGYSKKDKNIIPALSKFCGSLLAMSGRRITKGLAYLLPRPESGSACKRLNLFLRWMVRKDSVDAGLWKAIDKAKLIVPVDVHMGRLCRILGLYKQKTVSLSAAVQITESFAALEPADPVKYDFALSRVGIIENCTGKRRNECKSCELSELCEINR